MFGHLEHAARVALDRVDDVVLEVNRAFRRAGAAGAVQPECRLVLVRVRGVERRARTVDQRFERGQAGERAAGDDEVFQPRQQVHDRQNLADQRFADDGRGRARVVENELVVALPEQRVDRDRDRANLDRAEEARVEGGAVVQEQDDALFGSEAEGAQRVPARFTSASSSL